MAILWALAAAFSFGTSDFIARGVAQHEGSVKTLFFLQLLGLPIAALFLLLSKEALWARAFTPAGLGAAGISFVGTAAALLLFRALSKGPLLIVSPIVSSFAAVTAILALIVGERPAIINAIGMVVTLSGVVLSAITTGGSGRGSQTRDLTMWLSGGVGAAVGAALLFGVDIFLLRFVVPSLGSVLTTFITRVSSFGLLSAIALLSSRTVGLRSAGSLKRLVPMGVLDTIAVWSANQSLLIGLTSVVSVIISLFGVVTVVLGYLIARERITRVQQVGILITLVGVALVSV